MDYLSGNSLGLENMLVDIYDSAYLSDYFNITDFNPSFGAGKNLLVINTTDKLSNDPQIKIEARDSKNNYLYIESYSFTDKVSSKSKYYYSIHVYENYTVNGPGKLTIIGKTKDNKLVKWSANLGIDNSSETKSKILFYNKPVISVSPILTYRLSSFPEINPKTITGSCYTLALNPPKDFDVTYNYNKKDLNYQLIDNNAEFSKALINFPLNLNIHSIKKFNSSIAETINDTKVIYVKDVLNKTSLLLSDPYIYQNNKISEILSASYTCSFNNIKYNSSSFITSSYAKENIDFSGNSRFVKDSYGIIQYLNLDTFSGNVKRHKLYKKDLSSAGDFELIADETLSNNELLIDVTTPNKSFEKLGSFYTQFHINNFWFTSSNNFKLYYDSSIFSDAMIISGSNVNDGYIIAKPNSSYENRNASYLPFNISQSLNFSGSSFDCNYLKLYPNITYRLALNAAFIDKLTTDISSLEFYITSSSPNIQQEFAYNSKGLKIGELIFSGSSYKLYDKLQTFDFNVINETYGALVIYGKNFKSAILSDVSISPKNSFGFSKQTFFSKVPFPVVKSNDIFEIKSELYDKDNNLAYSSLNTVQYFDTNGESVTIGIGDTDNGITTSTLNSTIVTVSDKIIANKITSSLYGTSSWAYNSITSSYALNARTASYAQFYNTITETITTATNAITSSYSLLAENLNRNIGTPEMYGAKGDGITDDTIAIKHAFISHSVIQFDAKTYAVRGWLGVPSYRIISGMGKDKTVIKLMDNAPYGYNYIVSVFHNKFLNDSIKWINGYVNGTVDIENGDNSIVDQAKDSPLYLEPQSTDWGGLGQNVWYEVAGLRRDIIMKDFTIDCNFDNQPKHSTYNWNGNPEKNKYSYISDLSWKVRPTVAAINFFGENIVLENIKTINYGYGVPFLNTIGTINWSSITNNIPAYVECFPILINGAASYKTFSGSYVDATYYTPDSPFSRLKGNFIINCEVGKIADINLMNNWSNASAIVCTNSSLIQGAGDDGPSTWPTDGGIFNCIVDPGYNPKNVISGSFINKDPEFEPLIWPNIYPLDSYLGYNTWGTDNLINNGDNIGNDGDYSVGGYPFNITKKYNGKWYPYGSFNFVSNLHSVFGATGYRVVNTICKNVYRAVYTDSFRGSYFIENNQFINVDNGCTLFPGSLLSCSIHNFSFKNNYVKLSEPYRSSIERIRYGIELSTSAYTSDLRKTRHYDNAIIENNIIELPISSSSTFYKNTEFEVKPFSISDFSIYRGILLVPEDYPVDNYFTLYRNLVIKNNNFIYWNPPSVETSTTSPTNIPIWTFNSIQSISADTEANRKLIGNIFKNEILNRYIIENNTYNSSVYPSTASLTPIILNFANPINKNYPIYQVNKFDEIKVTGNITSTSITSSLYGTSSYALNVLPSAIIGGLSTDITIGAQTLKFQNGILIGIS